MFEGYLVLTAFGQHGAKAVQRTEALRLIREAFLRGLSTRAAGRGSR